MTSSTPISLVIADNHKMFVQALQHLLGRTDDFKVLGVTDNGTDLLELCNELRPDVALVDVSMPGPGCHAIAEALRRGEEDVKLLALTMHLEPNLAQMLIKQGFSGYVIKDEAFDELLSAIRSVAAGRVYMSTSILDMCSTAPDDVQQLTPREFECLKGAAEGMSNKAIAANFAISERTVKYHFENILRKLNATNRGEAVAISRRLNLI